MDQETEEDGLEWSGSCYQVDSSLGPLNAVLRYSRSELPAQRHAYIRGISAMALQVTQAAQGHALASTDPDPLDGVSPEFTADQLVELVLELLAPRSWGEDDPDTLVLALEQMASLRSALKALSSSRPAEAAVSAHVQHLCQACVDTLLRQREEEDVLPACLTAYASLITLLPPDRLQATLVKHVETLHAGGEDGSTLALAVALLASVLEEVVASEDTAPTPAVQQTSWDRLADLALQLVTLITPPDEDETAQKALVRHVATLSLLFPAPTRGADILLPVLKLLAANPLWSVRAAVADAVPAVIRAVDQPSPLAEPLPITTTQITPDRTCEALCELLTNVLGGDVSHWVRSSAIKAAGPVICALPRTVTVPPALLALYIQSVGGLRPQPTHVLQQAACCFSCVINQLFSNAPTTVLEANVAVQDGAVTSTAQQLLNVFLGLMSCGEGSVISHLVEQLPDLAAVFGPAVTAQVLIPPVLHLRDEEEQAVARQAILPKLASLIEMLPDQAAQELVVFVVQQVQVPMHQHTNTEAGGQVEAQGSMEGMAHGPGTATAEGLDDDDSVGRCGVWRQRLCLAEQLGPLTSCCLKRGGLQLVTSMLLPCTSVLCQDPVWVVRHEAAKQLGVILCTAVDYVSTTATHETVAMSSTTGEVAGVAMGSGVGQVGSDSVAGKQLVRRAHAQLLQLAVLGRAAGEQDGPQTLNEPRLASDAVHHKLSSLQLFVSACMGYAGAASNQGHTGQTLDVHTEGDAEDVGPLQLLAAELRDALCKSGCSRDDVSQLFDHVQGALHEDVASKMLV